jgi:ubiquitin-protein ligase
MLNSQKSREYGAHVPRSFKLRAELEAGEKDSRKDKYSGLISLGLVDGYDNIQGYSHQETYNNQLSDWQASIFGPQGSQLGERFYQILIKVPPKYPFEPPLVSSLSPLPTIHALACPSRKSFYPF